MDTKPKTSRPGGQKTPLRKKKKRRLRKEIRWFLWGLAALLLLVLIVNGISSCTHRESPKPADDQTQDEQKQGEEQTQQPDALAEQLGFHTWPDTGEKIATVVIDPGHGAMDGGNVASDGTIEKEINLKISKMVVEDLQKINPQLNVIMTRDSDEMEWADPNEMFNVYQDLESRLDITDQNQADYFISLHCNALDDPSVAGYDFFVKPDDTPMQEIIMQIQSNLEKAGWGTYHSTVTTDHYALQVVKESPAHAVLIEMAYMSNESDLALLKDEAQQERFAMVIAGTLSEYIMANPDTPKPVKPERSTEKARANGWID